MILETRARTPSAVAQAAAQRKRRPWLGPSGRLMIIAADHPARGSLGAGDRPLAMANRFDLLDRILVALGRPGVDGVLATADIMEDLLLLGALDGKLAIGSMNRGGITGAAFEFDDRFTGYRPAAIAAAGLDGGKMLLRMDLADPATAATLAACAGAVSELAALGVPAIVEPFIAQREAGRSRNDLSPDAVIRSIAIASGLGDTSAYTWLKIPVVDDMDRVAEASTLPTVLLGGDSGEAPDEMFARWQQALRLPNVRGLAVGRNILYPPGDDVAAAVDTAVSLM
ncbi:MAG TPA: deoxyribose-phosphate aldolase [Streptosporangiaceae bacterium]|nr:deoxyribose-phosphate aldolase [Streptosporangiaceae bacterium]